MHFKVSTGIISVLIVVSLVLLAGFLRLAGRSQSGTTKGTMETAPLHEQPAAAFELVGDHIVAMNDSGSWQDIILQRLTYLLNIRRTQQ